MLGRKTDNANRIKTEALAGFTTFLTMSYIIVVNPAILSTDGTGISFSGALTATVLVSALSTLLMGLIARLPFALAPGMGINSFFTFSIILGEQIPWQEALGLVFWSGIIFVVVSATPLRELIVRAIPHHLRLALACGIGLFLCVIGLKSGQFIQDHPVTLVTHAPFTPALGFGIVGLLTIAWLQYKKFKAGFLIVIVSITITAAVSGAVEIPKSWISMPDFSTVFFQADLLGSLKYAYIPALLSLLITDLFDSLSTFIGVSESAGMIDEKGEPWNIKKALFVDAIGTLASGLFGTSSATTYIESSAGTESGGRSGLTSVFTALCFLPFLFLGPLVAIVPGYATAPVLIFVGFLMFKNITKLPLNNLRDGIPCFIVILMIPLTFSITQGILWGFIIHVALYALWGDILKVHPLMMLMGVMGVFYVMS